MANKDPAYLFYPSDFEMGTLGMTYKQKGKYITLLNMQHSKGGYLKERDIKRILNFDNEDDLEILEKFKHNDNGYYNERLLNEIEKRRKHSQKQRENVLKRWNKKTSGIYGGNTNVIPLENENRNRNENINENINIIVNKTKIPYIEITNYWNKYSNLKPIKKITEKRKGFIHSRFQEYGLAEIKTMIDNVSNSPFLKGQNNRGWTADFEWCFKPNNFIKILEGNYLSKKPSSENNIETRAERLENIYGGKL